MRYDIVIKPLNTDNVTRFNAVSLEFLQDWIKTKSHSFEKNLAEGTAPTGKHTNRPQLKKQIK